MTIQGGGGRGRGRHRTLQYVVQPASYEKMLDTSVLVRPIDQILIHLVRLDLCSTCKKLLFRRGCVAQTSRDGPEGYSIIPRKNRLPSVRRKVREGSWSSQLGRMTSCYDQMAITFPTKILQRKQLERNIILKSMTVLVKELKMKLSSLENEKRLIERVNRELIIKRDEQKTLANEFWEPGRESCYPFCLDGCKTMDDGTFSVLQESMIFDTNWALQ